MVHRPGQRAAKPGQVCATIALRDVIGKTKHVLLVGVVPLQGDFHGYAIALALEIRNTFVDRGLVPVQMLDKCLDAAFEFENIVEFLAFVDQLDPDAGIEKRQLTKAPGQNIVVKFDIGKYCTAWPEAQRGTGTIGFLHGLHRCKRLTQAVFLAMHMTIAANFQFQVLGQRVDHGDTDPVKPAGDLVGIVVKLSARMQHRHDDFSGRTPFF